MPTGTGALSICAAWALNCPEENQSRRGGVSFCLSHVKVEVKVKLARFRHLLTHDFLSPLVLHQATGAGPQGEICTQEGSRGAARRREHLHCDAASRASADPMGESKEAFRSRAHHLCSRS